MVQKVGELCSKILAAGGADVKFSYHRGKAEAQKLSMRLLQTVSRPKPFNVM